MTDPFHDSRPSGILPAKSGFNVAKFLGLTVALAAGAGAGIGGYLLLRNRAQNEEPEPVENPAEVQPDKQDATPPKKVDVPPPEPEPGHDDGKLRLDLPDHPSNRPSRPGGDEPGPDVEVPQWD